MPNTSAARFCGHSGCENGTSPRPHLGGEPVAAVQRVRERALDARRGRVVLAADRLADRGREAPLLGQPRAELGRAEAEHLALHLGEAALLLAGRHVAVQELGLRNAGEHDRAELVDEAAQERAVGRVAGALRQRPRSHGGRDRVVEQLPAHRRQAVAVDGQEAQRGVGQRERADGGDAEEHAGVGQRLHLAAVPVVGGVGLAHDDRSERRLGADPLRDLGHGRVRRVAGVDDLLDRTIVRERQGADALEHGVEPVFVGGHIPPIGIRAEI